jgi:hypothetical protein
VAGHAVRIVAPAELDECASQSPNRGFEPEQVAPTAMCPEECGPHLVVVRQFARQADVQLLCPPQVIIVNTVRAQVGQPSAGRLAFSVGPHFCLGAALARLEGRVALQTLLLRLPTLRLETSSIEWKPNVLLRGPRALPVVFGS